MALFDILQPLGCFLPSCSHSTLYRRLGTPTPKCHPELCALPGFNRWARAHPRRHRGVGLVYLPDRITVERADFLRKLLVVGFLSDRIKN